MTRELIGVYHADGGIVGELRYVVGKALGVAHCALCDITHSPVRRKREWDAMVQRRGWTFTLLHLNELNAAQEWAVKHYGSPCVLEVTPAGLQCVLNAYELDLLEGSVEAFEVALTSKLNADRP